MINFADIVSELIADGRPALAAFVDQVVVEDGLRNFSDLKAVAKSAGVRVTTRDPILVFEQLQAVEQHAQFH